MATKKYRRYYTPEKKYQLKPIFLNLIRKLTSVRQKTGLLIAFVLCSCAASAQFSDSITHYVSYGANGIINRTNEGSSYVITNALRFNINKKKIRLNSTNSWIYGEQRQRLTNNDFNSTLDFTLYQSGHFYYWGLGSYDKSYSLKINRRVQAGLGIAYSFVDKPNTFVNISDGILYENSNLQVNDSTNNTYNILRNSFRLRYRFAVKETLVFDGIHFFQNSLSDNNDYIIKSISNLTFKIRKWLGFTTSLTYNRTQLTRRENLLITFGLTAEKYF